MKPPRPVERLCRLLPESGPVGLVGGSQVVSVARGLRDRENLLIVTNAVEVATALPALGGPSVLLLPGRVGPRGTVHGRLLAAALGTLNLDVLVIVADGVHPEAGVTVADSDEADVVRSMVAVARRTAVLVPRHAVGRRRDGAECLALDRIDLLVGPPTLLPQYADDYRMRKDAS